MFGVGKGGTACRQRDWMHFDRDVFNIIQATGKRDVDRRLQTMTTIIATCDCERFRQMTKDKTKHIYELHISNSARASYPEEEVPEFCGHWQQLMTLRREEWHGRRGREGDG